MYATRRELRRISLDTADMTSVKVLENLQNSIAVDFDYESKTIFWSDVLANEILRVNFDGTNNHVVVSNLTTPDGISVDWIAKNIYWTDTGKDTISVARFDGSHIKTLINNILDEPRGISVFPQLG